jgi:hypothetical protein
MVLKSESVESSDLMYLEYANRIVKSLDQDDDWNVWFEFYFGDTYDVVINLQEKKISFVNSYFQEVYMHQEKHFENPGIIYKGLYLKGFEFPNTVEDNHKNYSNTDCIEFVKDYILRAFFVRESPEYQYHFGFQDRLICSSDFEVIKDLNFKKLLFKQTESEDKVIKEIAINSFKTMIYNDPKKLLEIYFYINKHDTFSLQFPISCFKDFFGVEFLLENIAKFKFDDLNIKKSDLLIYSKKDNGDYHLKDLSSYFSKNRELVSRNTFEGLDDFCLSMIFSFDDKNHLYYLNNIFAEFVVCNINKQVFSNSKYKQESDFIVEMIKESLLKISRKEIRNVNMLPIKHIFSLFQENKKH